MCVFSRLFERSIQAVFVQCLSFRQAVENNRQTRYTHKYPVLQVMWLLYNIACFITTGSAHTCDQPSKYCDVMVEQLIIPITEAAGQLGEQAQRVYMDLAVSILFNEYRRVITQNKYTYRYTL